MVHKFGALQELTSTEDIWFVGGAYPWPTAAETVRIKAGGDAADDSDGAGAQKVMVEGLDANFAEVSEELTTNGTSVSSATTQTFIRLHRAYVTDTGTYTGVNTAAINIENSSSTNVIAAIATTFGQTEMSMYTVPAGYTAFLTNISVGISGAKAGSFCMFQRRNANDVTTPFSAKRIVWRVDDIIDPVNTDFGLRVSFPEKTDIWLTGVQGTGNAPDVEATYGLVLVQN